MPLPSEIEIFSIIERDARNKEGFGDLAVGDKVAVYKRDELGTSVKITTVDRVTKKLIEVDGTKYNKDRGDQYGSRGDFWYIQSRLHLAHVSNDLVEAVKRYIEEYKDTRERKALAKQLIDFGVLKIAKLDAPELQRIINNIEAAEL